MRLVLVLTFLCITAPVLANHPEDRLDEVMAKKEPAFEISDRRDIPNVKFLRDNETEFGLGTMEDQIVVLSFVPNSCRLSCSDQQLLLAQVQDSISITPMRDMVKFVTVT